MGSTTVLGSMARPAGLSPTTRVFAVLGSPIAHSLSPALHTATYAQLNLDAAYTSFEVDESTLAEALRALSAAGFAGVNLTMPLKTAALPLMDALSPAAGMIGAVNTVSLAGERCVGHNTDGAGMIRAIVEAGGQIDGARVLILGAGGAARAIAAQAALDGAACVSLTKRPGPTFDHAAAAAGRFAATAGRPVTVLPYEEGEQLRAAAASADVLINATPIGMGEDAASLPVPAHYLHAGLTVADAVYHPRRTRLLEAAEAAGARCVDGLGMLVWQALLAEDIWFGEGTTASVDIAALMASAGIS